MASILPTHATAVLPQKTLTTKLTLFRHSLSRDNLILATILILLTIGMSVFILAPLFTMLLKSLQSNSGQFIGLSNFRDYFSSSAMWQSLRNTLFIGIMVTSLVSVLAFGFAYALTRSCMPFKSLFNVLGSAPILAPSLLPGISLIYLLGNQGIAKDILMGHSVYGPIGITIGLTFWCFPHALMIIKTSLRTSDARLYEAAQALNTSPIKTFFIITLPGAKYGLISAIIVVFTLVVCDFCVPKVIGGSYNILATDIFKQVVGQQNFSMGAVTSVILLIPALFAFGADRWVQKKQKGLFDSRSVAYIPQKISFETHSAYYFVPLSVLQLSLSLVWQSTDLFVTFWPWNLTISLHNYNFFTI